MSNCLQCGKVNPPSRSNKKRKYCSKPCSNKYLHKISPRRYVKKNPNWGLKTREQNERRAEFERSEADPNLFSPRRIQDEMGISVSQVSLRGKLLEIEPVKVIKYSGHMTYYSKEQAEKIKNFVEIVNKMKEEGKELPTAYVEYSKERSEYGKDRRRKLFEEGKKNPKAYAERANKQWLYRKDRINKYPHVKLQRNVSLAVFVACRRQGSAKGGSTWKTLPYTSKELKEHLEGQWEEWMSWDNYGTKWHMDHIIPQSKLIYDSVQHPNFLRCWSLENLRPLCSFKNRSKGSYYEGEKHTYDA